jgi:MFS family permease
MRQGRLVVLMGVPTGFTLGGLLASRLVQVFGWPAIFIVGGVLPFVMNPVLALWLPESTSVRVARNNPVIAQFGDRLASSTVLLWANEFPQFVGRLSDSIVDTVNPAYDWCEHFECYSRHVDLWDRHHSQSTF